MFDIVMGKIKLELTLKKIGAELGRLRERMGYESIKEFASDHNLSMIQYWRIERGKSNITLKTLVKLLAIHRLTIDDFFCMLI